MMQIEHGDGRKQLWYVGDKFPELRGSVINLQADGHELQWLQLALEVEAQEANKDYYKRVWGVTE